MKDFPFGYKDKKKIIIIIIAKGKFQWRPYWEERKTLLHIGCRRQCCHPHTYTRTVYSSCCFGSCCCCCCQLLQEEPSSELLRRGVSLSANTLKSCYRCSCWYMDSSYRPPTQLLFVYLGEIVKPRKG